MCQSICLRTDGIKVAISASRTLPIALWFVRDSHHWLRAAGDSSAGAPSAPSRPVVVPSAAPGGKPWGLAQWRWAYDTPVGSTGLFFAPMIPYRHRYGDFCPAPRATARAAIARACPPATVREVEPRAAPARRCAPCGRDGWQSDGTCEWGLAEAVQARLEEQRHLSPVAQAWDAAAAERACDATSSHQPGRRPAPGAV